MLEYYLYPQAFFPGWWYTCPSEKKNIVRWDDEIPNIWKNKSHVPKHQPLHITSPQCINNYRHVKSMYKVKHL